VLYLQSTIGLTMSKDKITRVLKDIEEQGFPLEVKTSEVLETYDWEVTNQLSYFDYGAEKYRTVDIVALKNLLMDPGKLGVDVNLVVECKKKCQAMGVL